MDGIVWNFMGRLIIWGFKEWRSCGEVKLFFAPDLVVLDKLICFLRVVW